MRLWAARASWWSWHLLFRGLLSSETTYHIMVPTSSTVPPTIHQLADTRVSRRMPVESHQHLHMLKPDGREQRKDINEESSRGGVGVARRCDGVAGRVGFRLLKR